MLADLDLEAPKVGLKIHPNKTKIQYNNIGYGVGAKEAKCRRISVEILSKEETAAYLGRVVNLGNLHDTELHNRIAKAWAKFCIFKKELKDQAIPIHLRFKLFDAVVTPTILYGSEVWTMTLQRQKKLRAMQRKMMRLITHAHRSYNNYENYVDWIEAETSKVVKLIHDQKMECWTILQRRKMWNWAEKMTSTKGQRWNKTVNSWLLNDIRSRGKPKYKWHDIMNEFLGKVTGRLHRENDLQKTGANKSEWMSMAKDFEKETSLMNDPDIDEL